MDKLRIGILDSNHIAQRCVQMMIINHFDAEVITFDITADLIRELETSKIDLIIVEYNMPEIQGDQLFHFIQSNAINTKIIFWSTEVIEGLRKNLIKGGVLDFIVKSDESINELKLAVGEFLNDREDFQFKMKKAFNKRMKLLGQLGGRVKKYVGDDSLESLADKIDHLKYDKDF